MTRYIFTSLFILICFATFAQQKQSDKAKKHKSFVIDQGLVKISIMYPFEEGNTFDMEYYKTKHMPMVAGFLGTNMVNYTIEKGLASGIPNRPLPFMAIGTFYVKNLEEYQKSIAPHREAIRADFANYTNATPIILVSEGVK